MQEKHTQCHFCNNTCPVSVQVEGGNLLSVKRTSSPGAPIKSYCPKNLAAPDIVHAPDRITSPLLRKNLDRNEDFQEKSWDDALGNISKKLNFYKKEYGAESVAWLKGTGDDWGPLWHYAQRLMNAFGSPNAFGNGSLCHVTRLASQILTYGGMVKPDLAHTECILVWGKNDKTSSPPGYGSLTESRKQGATLVVIDPIETDLAKSADLWLQIKPGCDGILAMSLIHQIIAKEYYDADYVKEYSIGFEQLQKAVENYAPEKVASDIWLSAESICQLAELYSTSKTACILDGNGLEMNADVIQNVRAISILRALSGNLDIKGGELIGLPLPTNNLLLQENIPSSVKPISTDYNLFNSLCKPVGDSVNTVIPDAILDKKPYPIKALILHGTNPVVSVANSKRFAKALEHVEFVVVIDMFMTRSAQYADVFLPASTCFEKTQLNMSSLSGQNMTLQEKVIDPVGNSRPDWQIIFDLAHALGLEEYFPWNTIEEAIDYQLEPSGINVAQLRENPSGVTYQKPQFEKFKNSGFNTPSKKIEFFSQRLLDNGQSPLPSFELNNPGKIAFRDQDKDYPLIGISGEKSTRFIHTRYRNIPSMLKREPEPFIDMSPQDAKARDIKENDEVLISSPIGEISMKVKISDIVTPSSVRIPWGWGEYDSKYCINSLTGDTERDPVSSTPSVRSFMCEVRKR